MYYGQLENSQWSNVASSADNSGYTDREESDEEKRRKNVEYRRVQPRTLSGTPLTKKPENSGYEIAKRPSPLWTSDWTRGSLGVLVRQIITRNTISQKPCGRVSSEDKEKQAIGKKYDLKQTKQIKVEDEDENDHAEIRTESRRVRTKLEPGAAMDPLFWTQSVDHL